MQNWNEIYELVIEGWRRNQVTLAFIMTAFGRLKQQRHRRTAPSSKTKCLFEQWASQIEKELNQVVLLFLDLRGSGRHEATERGAFDMNCQRDENDLHEKLKSKEKFKASEIIDFTKIVLKRN